MPWQRGGLSVRARPLSDSPHDVEVGVEFKPVERPVEPVNLDQPVKCPLPEPSILHILPQAALGTYSHEHHGSSTWQRRFWQVSHLEDLCQRSVKGCGSSCIARWHDWIYWYQDFARESEKFRQLRQKFNANDIICFIA